MRRILSALLVFVLIQLVVATPVSKPQEPAQNQTGASSVLVNKDVVDMAKSGLTADVIVAKIKSSRCHFDTFPSVLAELKYRGVPDSVLLAMVEFPSGGPPVSVQERKQVPGSGTKPADNIGGVILRDRSETPYNARIYVAPMEEGFDGLVSALMIEKKLPMTIVVDENLADFILVGATNKGPHKWYDTVFGGGYERDRTQGSIRVIRVKDKTVIWASQAGDRSIWWGSLKKGGRRKVAERLVNKMKDDLFKSTSKS